MLTVQSDNLEDFSNRESFTSWGQVWLASPLPWMRVAVDSSIWKVRPQFLRSLASRIQMFWVEQVASEGAWVLFEPSIPA